MRGLYRSDAGVNEKSEGSMWSIPWFF